VLPKKEKPIIVMIDASVGLQRLIASKYTRTRPRKPTLATFRRALRV